jgi:hypothetical protein
VCCLIFSGRENCCLANKQFTTLCTWSIAPMRQWNFFQLQKEQYFMILCGYRCYDFNPKVCHTKKQK